MQEPQGDNTGVQLRTQMNIYEQRMRELNAKVLYAEKGGLPISLSEEQLQDIERQIGHTLPKDYGEFLRDFGGYTLYAFFPCQSPTNGGYESISVFYGLMPDNRPDLSYSATLDVVKLYRGMNEYKPHELLPIGDDPGGNQICLAIFGDNKGSVYFWDRVEAWQTSDYTGIYKIANSFDEFVQILITEEEFETA